MVLWDDRLLELSRSEGAISPSTAKDSGYLPISKAHISRRLDTLANHRMMTRMPNGVYEINETGEQYLEGEIDANELPDMSEDEGTASA